MFTIVGVLLVAGALFTPRTLAARLSVLPGVGSYLAAGLDYFSRMTVGSGSTTTSTATTSSPTP